MKRARLLLLAAVAAGAVGAATPEAGGAGLASVTVRSVQHRDFGRLELDFPRGLRWRQAIEGDLVVLSFAKPVRLRPSPSLPRNVLGMAEESAEVATVRLAPGARARMTRRGTRLLIDALDPPPGQAAAQPTDQSVGQPSPPPGLIPQGEGEKQATQETSPPLAQGEGEKHVTQGTSSPLAGGVGGGGATHPAAAAPLIANAPPPAAASAPDPIGPSLALVVERVPPPKGTDAQDGAAILVPFGADVGAAALSRGDELLVVFDAPKPLDLAALRADPVFSTAAVEVLPTATLLRMRPPPGLGVTLTRGPGGWRLALGRGQEPPHPIPMTQSGGALLLPASRPGRVVAVADPVGGGVLLLGTQLQPGQAMEAARQTPEFGLPRTLQGVAVEPLSDRLQLDSVKEGFRLSGAGGPLALGPASLPDGRIARAPTLTRRFDLPALPRETLRRRLDAELADAAAAPPLARGRPRMAVARTMLALGLDQEALGALRAAAAADPRLADDPDLLGLEGAAEVLAGRPDEAGGLLDPRLSGTDEVALWRALREAMTGPTSEVAATLAATAPLLLSYPAAVRDRLLALALETMAVAGQAEAAAPFLAARPGDPRLALARAMAAEANGDAPAALAGYDALAGGRDRLARLRGAMRAIDLRLAQKQITPAQGVEALERLDAAWRGGPYDLARRERLAELRLETGAWRPALALLRDSAARFPEAAPALRTQMRDAVARLLRDDATRAMPPLDFVALLEENADLLGDLASGPDLQTRLADRLLALDLPDAAAPLLEHLMRDAPAGAGRAATGARLAKLRLAGGDAQGALAALAQSGAGDLPPPLAERRTLLSAEAKARLGETASAAAELASLGTPEADRVRADILERAGDLPGALAALTALADRTVPAQGALDEPARQTLLRLVALAARTRDQAALAAIRTRVAGRLDAGQSADAIRLLLSEPVRQVADLARAGREATLAGAVASGLRATPVAAPQPAGH